MARDLPPLGALRVFEAAARQSNFSRAAEELHVTPGAVSHQIKALEAFMGTPLFLRQGRRTLTLSRDGRQLAEQARGALQRIVDASERIRRRRQPNRLSVSMLPSFAGRWLMPRIGRFLDAHAGLDFNVQTSTAHVDFARDDIDLAIRFGPGGWPDVHAELLQREEQFPVCNPQLTRGRKALKPSDLLKLPLLQAEPPGWSPWFKAVDVGFVEPRSMLGFNDAGLTLQAAIDGRGVMLARRMIAERDLMLGNIVRPFDVAVPTDYSYYLVSPRDSEPSEAAMAFRAWLVAELALASTRRPRKKSSARSGKRQPVS